MARETLIQMRQGAITSWASANPVLAAGEFGVATDINLIKVGDGTTTFNNLGFFANTLYANAFTVGQTIAPKQTNDVGLKITSGMRYAIISSALRSSNGAQVTYTYATNGGGLTGGLISVGDYVTTTGFSNTSFNNTNAEVVGVTTGEFPTFTINQSGTPSASVTGNSNTWFYETTTAMANLQTWRSTGPGGSAGSSAVETVAYVTPDGAVNSVATVTGVNLTANGGSITRTQLIDGGSTTATFNNSGQLVRTTSSARYKQDIEDANYSYEDVLSLQPKTFRLKEEAANNETSRVYGGLIAEEVAELDSLKVFVNYANIDGSTVPDGIQYGEMVSALVSAIKHQDSVIKDLTTRLETLEKKVK